MTEWSYVLADKVLMKIEFLKDFFQKNKKMQGWVNEATSNQIHIQYYWLTKCTNKNPNVNGHISHNHPYT